MTDQQLNDQLSGLFRESPERYLSFLELKKRIEAIKDGWRNRFNDALRSKMRASNTDTNKWSIRNWKGAKDSDNHWLEYTFYLDEFGNESFSLFLDNDEWKFWSGGGDPFVSKLKKLLRNERYRLLTEVGLNAVFSTEDDMYNRKDSTWNIKGSNMTNFQNNFDEFCWYVGNSSEEVAEEVIKKLDRIRLNTEVLSLFKQIQLEARKVQ